MKLLATARASMARGLSRPSSPDLMSTSTRLEKSNAVAEEIIVQCFDFVLCIFLSPLSFQMLLVWDATQGKLTPETAIVM